MSAATVTFLPESTLLLLSCGFLVGLVAGALGGLVAGFAGLGGGLIYVPVFYALLPGGRESVPVPIVMARCWCYMI